MTVKEIKEFLIMIMDKEMEEEYVTTDNKDFIASCIEAKKWLLGKGTGMDALVNIFNIKEDIDKYMH